ELGVLSADWSVADGVNDVAAAKDLDLHPITQATALDQLVDELLHGEIAIAGRLRIVTPATGMALRQHEVIHPAKPGDGAANAGRNARAEDRHQRLIRPGGHVVFAGKHLDDPRLAGVVKESSALSGIDALLASDGNESLRRSAHPSLR